MKAAKIENEHPLPAGFEDSMAEVGLELALVDCRTGEDLEACAHDAEIVWLYNGSRLLWGDNLLRIPRCGLILRVGSGTDNVDVPRATELGIVVANTPQINAEHVCDHTIALLLAEADYVSLHCSYGPETHHILGPEQLAQMKPGAVLINTGRGRLVDEVALLEALQSRRLAAAGLDVFCDEPLNPGHAFCRMENVVLTPHAAAYSERFPADCYKEVLSVFGSVAAGIWPTTIVNPDGSPRWDLLLKAKETACRV